MEHRLPDALRERALSLFETALKHGPHRADLFNDEDFKAIAAELRHADPSLEDWCILAIALREAGKYLSSST